MRAAKVRTDKAVRRADGQYLSLTNRVALLAEERPKVRRRIKTIEEKLTALARRLSLRDVGYKALKAKLAERLSLVEGVWRQHDTHITALNNRLAVVEEFARSELANLAERVLAIEGRTERPPVAAVATISPAAEKANQTLTPEQLARLGEKPAKRKAVAVMSGGTTGNVTQERMTDAVEKAAEGWAEQVHQLDRDGYTADDVRQNARADFLAGVPLAGREPAVVER